MSSRNFHKISFTTFVAYVTNMRPKVVVSIQVINEVRTLTEHFGANCALVRLVLGMLSSVSRKVIEFLEHLIA